MAVTTVEGRRLVLSHLDKVMYPDGTTKGELLDYYARTVSAILPHIWDRPLSFLRFPDGVSGERFMVKHPPPGTPPWVRTTPVPSSGGDLRQILVPDQSTLLWAANLGALELHAVQWHADEPGSADRMVLDLDPGDGADLLTCRRAALALRERLDQDGLTCWIKTSGAKGLHLLVPIRPTPGEQVLANARALAVEMAGARPDQLVHTMPKAERSGRVMIDWQQNAPSRTTIAPYSVRARPTPTVSTPLSWDELEAADSPAELTFTIRDLAPRLQRDGDLLGPLLNPSRANTLPPPPPPASAPARRPERPRRPATAPDSPVEVLEPPVELMRPRTVPTIPAADALPGGTRYELKLDGFRCAAFARGTRPPVLQSRSGRDLSPGFPAIASAVAALPAGLVLDGELCAWHEGKLAFEQLLRPRAARDADRVALALVVFDVLAVPGRDVRALPLHARIDLLHSALADLPPPLQLVMATTSSAEARTWFDTLGPQGVEGLVCKGLDSPYAPGGTGRSWVKVRHQDTLDAMVTAVTGTPRRPRALVLHLSDGSRVLSAPQLDALQARTLAAALDGRLGRPLTDPDFGPVHPLTDPLPAEVRAGTGRHAAYRYLRLRGD